MSQGNVEIVERASELFERRDWDRIADLLDPDVELHGTLGASRKARSCWACEISPGLRQGERGGVG